MSKFLIDIDGTLCTKGHNGKYTLAQPIVDNIKIVQELHEKGHEIVLFTARANAVSESKRENIKILTRMQMEDWGVKYSHIEWEKPESDYIIDDKCITFDEAKQVSPAHTYIQPY